jgi:hypothetical protein
LSIAERDDADVIPAVEVDAGVFSREETLYCDGAIDVPW